MKLRTLLIASLAALVSGLLVAQAQVPGVNSTLNSVFTLAYDNSTMKPTYSSTSNFVVTGTALNDACALSGSATKVLKVRRVIVSGVATAVESNLVAVNKYSTLYTAGNGSQPAVVSYDSSNVAKTGVVETWLNGTVTAGTLVGTLADVWVTMPNATTGIGNGAHTFTFGQLGQPLVLRGVAQYIAVNMNGATFSTGNLSCTFEWTEE